MGAGWNGKGVSDGLGEWDWWLVDRA